MHNADFVAEEHRYPASGWERMRKDIEAAMADEEKLEGMLLAQKNAALAETAEKYRGL